MNYIAEYNKKIQNNEVTVSWKVKTVYSYLVRELNNENSKFYYNAKKAEHAIAFIENFCKHSKGRFGNKPFLLELWQKALVSATFGFLEKETNLRRFRELILIVARKNGKSALGSAIALYMLFADNEQGPEIYSAATKREQAKIIWNEAVKMIKKSPALSKRSKCLVSEIKSFTNSGVFKPLASDSNSLDGLNVSCSLIDELHAIKEKNLYDVIVDGMTAREQPLSIITSTAGTIRENIFDLKYEECERLINEMAENNVSDFRTLPIIYELDNRSEWTKQESWAKANPGLGTIKSLTQLKDKVNKAKANNLLVKNLLCKDFNIRETSDTSFLSFEQLNNTETFNIKEIGAKYAIGGIDLSKTTDLTCATILFKTSINSKFYVQQMYWIPEDLLEKRVNEDKVPYDIWLKNDLLRTSPGNQIDYRLIIDWFLEVQRELNIYIYKIGYDAWSAQYFTKELENNFGALNCIAVIQGKKTLSAPMHALAAELEAKNIVYNNNPILKWCMANVSVDIDKNGNIQPEKSKQRKRIDGFASLLDAYTVYTQTLEEYHNAISY